MMTRFDHTAAVLRRVVNVASELEARVLRGCSDVDEAVSELEEATKHNNALARALLSTRSHAALWHVGINGVYQFYNDIHHYTPICSIMYSVDAAVSFAVLYLI